MDLNFSAFTWVHTIISLVAIVAGYYVVGDLIGKRRAGNWTEIFLVTIIATSVTGFFFRSASFGPPQVVGALSLIVLAAVLAAAYVFHFAGPWRWVYAVGIVVALYFDVFVLVAQLFQKVHALKALAPTGSEPPFAIVQLIVLVAFVYLGYLSFRRFRSGWWR
ncbi:MAG: hypothetical protein P4L82_13265 [Ancalomicrobiaceae bacterium]|nr:hypothetical protein [Ancalomicrobiaceae bacterium]